MLSTIGLSGQKIKSYLLIRVGFLIFTLYPVALTEYWKVLSTPHKNSGSFYYRVVRNKSAQ